MYDFLKSFSDTQQLSASAIIVRLLACFTISAFIAIFYQRIYRNQLPIKEMTPLILLALCIAAVLMSIGNSIPHSFGLFAALTLIRFRTPIKNSKDLVTLFFFIVIGITCGLGHFKVAFISVTFISVAIYLINLVNQTSSSNIILQVLHQGGSLADAQKSISESLVDFCKSVTLSEVRSINKQETEFIFELSPKENHLVAEILDRIRSLQGVEQAFVLTSFNEAEVF